MIIRGGFKVCLCVCVFGLRRLSVCVWKANLFFNKSHLCVAWKRNEIQRRSIKKKKTDPRVKAEGSREREGEKAQPALEILIISSRCR